CAQEKAAVPGLALPPVCAQHFPSQPGTDSVVLAQTCVDYLNLPGGTADCGTAFSPLGSDGKPVRCCLGAVALQESVGTTQCIPGGGAGPLTWNGRGASEEWV